MPEPTRRHVLRGAVGALALASLGACSSARGTPAPTVGGHTAGIAPMTAAAPAPGGRVVTATLTPRPVTLDLGGVEARTWAYAESLPGPVLRARAGDLLRVTVHNRLPAETTVHWHGIRLRHAADGVPGITQAPIAAGADYRYDLVVPDPGTYFFHPHVGVQLDRGLSGPLVVDDPHDPGDYDVEWVVVLDDWTDGVGRSPDDILAGFRAQNGTVSTGMSHMSGMGHMGSASPLGDAGDIPYPHYLVNGRIPAAPATLSAKPGQRARIRFINAGADTIFAVALGGHPMTVTHSDGYPVRPVQTPALYIAMGERYDVTVRLRDGAFPLVARAEGKNGAGLAIVRTGSGAAPTAATRVAELSQQPLLGTSLAAAESARLPERDPDDTVEVQLNGQMQPYAWGLNGKRYGEDTPIGVTEGQRLRLRMTNMTMMSHPMHLHGHTWGLPGSGGLRKDTVLIPPMQTVEADLQADNPGTWAYHCHNVYHGEVGMMTTLRYA